MVAVFSLARNSFNLHSEIVGCEASKTILHGALTKFPFCTALQELQFFTSLLCSKSCFFLALNSLLNQNSQAFAIFLLIQRHPSYPLYSDLTSWSADCIPSRLNLCCAQIWLIDCLLMVHEVVILWILTSALTELFTISCSTSSFTLMISSIECCLKTLCTFYICHTCKLCHYKCSQHLQNYLFFDQQTFKCFCFINSVESIYLVHRIIQNILLELHMQHWCIKIHLITRLENLVLIWSTFIWYDGSMFLHLLDMMI